VPPSELEEVARKICGERGLQFIKPEGEGTFKETFQVRMAGGKSIALMLYKAKTVTRRDKREIDSMLRCNHKHIARLLSVETYCFNGQNLLAITEEYLPGGTLGQKGRLTTAQCLAIGDQLIDALCHIAPLNLVHRDIKPENIMFTADGVTPVLTDFGVVRVLSDSSLTPTWAARGPGTPFFSSPEQLNNEKDLIDWRSDQFSLGIVLASLTLGDHPYRLPGMPDEDVVERVSSRGGPSNHFLRGVDAARLPALLRMAAPWPVDRFRKPDLLAKAWRSQEG